MWSEVTGLFAADVEVIGTAVAIEVTKYWRTQRLMKLATGIPITGHESSSRQLGSKPIFINSPQCTDGSVHCIQPFIYITTSEINGKSLNNEELRYFITHSIMCNILFMEVCIPYLN